MAQMILPESGQLLLELGVWSNGLHNPIGGDGHLFTL